ncbi:MAG TPA: cupredoxin domain-containing protein [Actinomycetota bacterium]|jgi:plastocyanin|nr:cupredoxin domain-containing protein [Actinomycetota bacterium]
MRRRRGGLIIGALVGVLALAAAGCGGGDDDGGSAAETTAAPQTTSAAATTAGGGGENELKLTASGTAWDTTSLEMAAGAEVSVEVTNQDSIEHNFTFAEAGADQDVGGGEDVTVTFTAPAAGSYEFFCKIHPQAMRGTVTVT